MLSEDEINNMERVVEFNNRIEALKKEVNVSQRFLIDNLADELDPHVKNLPHNIINFDEDKEEVAE